MRLAGLAVPFLRVTSIDLGNHCTVQWATTMSEMRARLPSEIFAFTLSEPNSKGLGPRLGTIAFKGRAPLQTPHYIALSSRGAVPHLSQDVMRKYTSIRGVHVALEDCKSVSRGLLERVC